MCAIFKDIGINKKKIKQKCLPNKQYIGDHTCEE